MTRATTPQFELFDTTQVSDPSLRDYPDTMAFPFLSLQKDRIRPIEFRDRARGIAINVAAHPGYHIASIWDWDFVIAISSLLDRGLELKLPAPSTLSFVPYQVLKIMGKGNSGREYLNLASTIRRLQATRVETNIRMADLEGGEGAFNWLAGYSFPKKYHKDSITQDAPEGVPDPTKPWTVVLPPWLYRAVERQDELLAVHQEYFALKSGIERWLYRVARQHLAGPRGVPVLCFPLAQLHRQSGLTSPVRKLRDKLLEIERDHPLPEYGIGLSQRNDDTKRNDNTIVTLYRKADFVAGQLPLS